MMGTEVTVQLAPTTPEIIRFPITPFYAPGSASKIAARGCTATGSWPS